MLGFTFGYEILRALLKRAGIARTAWGRRARSIGGFFLLIPWYDFRYMTSTP